MEKERAIPTVIDIVDPERIFDIDGVNALLKLSNEEILKIYETWNFDKRPLIERDTLIEAMRIRKLLPTEETVMFEVIGKLYPDIDRPDFVKKISFKKEFAQLQSKAILDDDLCSKLKMDFDTTNIQKLIARFINPETPYNSMLLFHGVGVGKTCTAITVAENFLDSSPDNKVFILVPPSIRGSFERTVFNIDKIYELPAKERKEKGISWRSVQCTGDKYLKLAGVENERDRNIVQANISSLIKQRYAMYGYGAFANYVRNKFKTIPAHIVDEERTKLENQLILREFSDKLFIIDEAHNLRDEDTGEIDGDENPDKTTSNDAAEGKKLTRVLNRILGIARGTKLLLMTATPMYNVVSEVVGLFNYLILNDTKDSRKLLKKELLFNSKGDLNPGTLEKISELSEHYVSYMRGENPATFPLRLLPENIGGAKLFEKYPKYSLAHSEGTVKITNEVRKLLENSPIVPTKYTEDSVAGKMMIATLKDRQKRREKDIVECPPDKIYNPDTGKCVKRDGQIGRKLVKEQELISHDSSDADNESTVNNTSLLDEEIIEDDEFEVKDIDFEETKVDMVLKKIEMDPLFQAANIIFPNYSSGNSGFRQYFKSEEFGAEPRLLRYIFSPQNAIGADVSRLPTIDDIFAESGLKSHAPKIANILDALQKNEGIGFIVSKYVDTGVLISAFALERAGYSRVLSNGKVEPLLKNVPPLVNGRQCALCHRKEKMHGDSDINHNFIPANYAILVGDSSITPKVDDLVKYGTTFPKTDKNAPYGSIIKVLIGSRVAFEGLDLKCIRQIHVLDPWWHLNRIEQIIGRGVRYCSHVDLPKEKRNCTTFLHVATVDEYETIDMYAYRIACKKAIPVGSVQRVIKLSAIDCNLNIDALILHGEITRDIVNSFGNVIEDYKYVDKPFSSICDYAEDCIYKCKSEIPTKWLGVEGSTYDAKDSKRTIYKKFELLKELFREQPYYPLSFIVDHIFKEYENKWYIVALELRNILDNKSFIVEQKDGTKGTLRLKNGYLIFQPIKVTTDDIPLIYRQGLSYGILPKQMKPLYLEKFDDRKSNIISIVKENVAEKIKKELSQEELEVEALTSLERWDIVLEELKDYRNINNNEYKPNDLEINSDFLKLVKWIVYRFQKCKFINELMQQLFIDYVWTIEERKAILEGIIKRRGTSLENGDSDLIKLFSTTELFSGNGITGYLYYKDGLQIRCRALSDKGQHTFLCPTNLYKNVEKNIGESINGTTHCGKLYGFQTLNGSSLVYKTLNQDDIITRGFRGSNCSVTSNKIPIIDRINILYELIKTNNLTELKNLMIAPIEREKVSKYDFETLEEMTSSQLCIYLELLLRAFDKLNIMGKNWSLNLVDTARAKGPQRGRDGRLLLKELFVIQEKN